MVRKGFNPRHLPDFTQKKIIDRHMERLDTSGVSRRDFLSLASAGVAASAAAAALGMPNVAVASGSNKVAYLAWSASTEYNQLVSLGAEKAASALGLNYSFFDGQIDSGRQLSQFEQLGTEQAIGGFFNILDGSALRRAGQFAEDNQTFFAAIWDSVPWFTPFDVGDYFTVYLNPHEDEAHRGVARAVYQAVTDKFGEGEVAALTGTPGNWCEISRNAGRNLALEEFPNIRQTDELPGKWLREESLRATEDLLTRNGNLRGIVAQNDDEAQGALTALRNAGLRPGEDFFVGGADGTSLGAKAIQEGLQTSTSGNSPVFTGAFLTSWLYDVANGWKPRAAERQLFWKPTVVTKDNVDAYVERYVDNNGVDPFDFRKFSRVLNPDDWDPQAYVYPAETEEIWKGYQRPEGWTLPAALAEAKAQGEFDAVREDYAARNKIKFDGPSPNKPA
ncbi:sugar ABC transporter substrate-binding protein [Pseudomonas sp. GX19020]|uniref:sugar ABC transporter substrate-binding protein n=1 Tax=Pseudomonas sp. GX19020 TaxID=2942277 RepID=UPI002019C9BB|nr:sugar ABC transporter substrate-binding protein [Pseudomonas sp. GX19020]MCL4066045.1 sugar ABC transporter substrate-binding protein [Pseudomonas sp. GX19020]